MRLIREWHSAHSHVSVADGFNLFQVVPFGDTVELPETRVEFFDQLLRREALGNLSESNKVGKQYRSILIIDWLPRHLASAR
jgi:hypothetical protein